MKKRISIADTDLSLCPIGLGTVGAGLDWDGADADRVFDTYLDLGGNLVDTAHVYSDWAPSEVARSERVVGEWLARSGKRNEVVLMTKGGHPAMTVENPDMHQSRVTRADMVCDLNASLKKLCTDHIDIYFFHRDNTAQSVGELVEIMRDFVREGKIRYFGCSNWAADRMIAADDYCRRHGYRSFVANQSLLNLGLKYMNPLPDDTLASFDSAVCAYHQKTPSNLAMPYMSVCSGFFHHYEERGEESVKNSPYYTPGNLRVAKRVGSLMEKYHASVSQVLLGFFSVQDFACAPLFGPRTVLQLKDAMATLDLVFEKSDFAV